MTLYANRNVPLLRKEFRTHKAAPKGGSVTLIVLLHNKLQLIIVGRNP